MDFCALNRLNQADVQFINEYCETMTPLAYALDFLQSESGMFMGYLLPTLHSLKRSMVCWNINLYIIAYQLSIVSMLLLLRGYIYFVFVTA